MKRKPKPLVINKYQAQHLTEAVSTWLADNAERVNRDIAYGDRFTGNSAARGYYEMEAIRRALQPGGQGVIPE